MKSSLKSNTWTDENICALKICYDAHVPIKLMAQYFGKTESSVTKMLTRSNIRPVGSRARGKRPSYMHCPFTTVDEIADIVQKTKDLPSFKLDDPATLFYVTRKKTRAQSAQAFTGKANSIEAWTSMTHLIAEFQKQGQDIIPTENPSLLRQGFTYMLNGAPKKSVDLLRMANIDRLAQRLPRIFIEGITDNN
jgi:hypothetical protein